jgi:hypothetical protein
MQFTQFELKALRDALVAGIQDLDNEIAIDSPYARFAESEVKLMRNLLEKVSKGIKKGGE